MKYRQLGNDTNLYMPNGMSDKEAKEIIENRLSDINADAQLGDGDYVLNLVKFVAGDSLKSVVGMATFIGNANMPDVFTPIVCKSVSDYRWLNKVENLGLTDRDIKTLAEQYGPCAFIEDFDIEQLWDFVDSNIRENIL